MCCSRRCPGLKVRCVLEEEELRDRKDVNDGEALTGQILRSATFRPLTPCTLRRSSRTPCLTMELPSLGAIEHVPRECQVVSTWPV